MDDKIREAIFKILKKLWNLGYAQNADKPQVNDVMNYDIAYALSDIDYEIKKLIKHYATYQKGLEKEIKNLKAEKSDANDIIVTLKMELEKAQEELKKLDDSTCVECFNYKRKLEIAEKFIKNLKTEILYLTKDRSKIVCDKMDLEEKLEKEIEDKSCKDTRRFLEFNEVSQKLLKAQETNQKLLEKIKKLEYIINSTNI